MIAPFAALAGVAVVAGGVVARRTARRALRLARIRSLVAHLNGSPSPRVTPSLSQAWRRPPTWLATQLRELQVPIDAGDVWRWWRASAIAAAIAGFLVGGPVLAALGPGMVVVAPVIAVAVQRSRTEAAYDTNLAAFLDAVGRGLRSGGSLPVAIQEASLVVRGAVAVDTQRLAANVARGQPIEEGLDVWAARRHRGSVRLTVGALGLAVATGGPPARVVEEVAVALRQRQQVESEARAMAAQARLSAIVVGLAPVGFALLTSVTDRRNAHLMFGTPIGVGCVALGIALDATGAVWMHRISESVQA